jgi:ComF family protein
MDAMRAIEGELCSICGERLFHFGPSPEAENICGMCRRARPAYTRAVAYGAYDGELRELIHLLKYERVRPAAELLGVYLAQAIRLLHVDLKEWKVVPVPLHRARRRQRGFNQAEVIAGAAVRRLRSGILGPGIEMRPGLLERRRSTSSQTGLTNHQRRANLRGAFVAPRPAELRNHLILLVDDVFTTGTTAAECSRVLLRAGARMVAVATVARVFKGEPARPVGFSHASFSHATEMAKGAEA